MEINRRFKRIAILSVIFAALFILFFFGRNTIISFVYHHRFFDGPPMESQKNWSRLGKTIDFKFSIKDVDFVNSFSNTISNRCNQWHPVDLDINGEKYSAEICRFDNYFKYINVENIKRSFSMRFPENNYHKGIRRFDIFQLRRISLLEQSMIYKIAEKLNLFIPQTEYPDIRVHGVYSGMSFFKEAYDHVFLERNNIPGGIVFSIEKDQYNKFRINYHHNPYNPITDAGYFQHINNFIKLLREKDKHLLLKFFDLDYIARFEMVRRLLGAATGFLIEDNVKIIYNIYNGKFYPILDESNIYNLQQGRANENFKILADEIKNISFIKTKGNFYMLKLAKSYDELKNFFQKQERAFFNSANKRFTSNMRHKLVASYFKNNVFKTLEKYKDQNFTKELDTAFFLMGSPWDYTTSYKYKPLLRESLYLDNMLLDQELFRNGIPKMNLKYASGQRLVLTKGDYTLKKNMYIPLGYVFQVEAGAVIRMGPGVSVISYSPINILGTKENPVIIKALDEGSPFGVWTVNGLGGEENIIRYLDFSGGSNAFISGCKFPGALNFHNTDIEMSHSRIHHCTGHDAFNVKRGTVYLEGNRFYANAVDHAALDFSKGIITGNRFVDNTQDREGDAIDLSGSYFYVSRNIIAQFVDKGLSVGEKSKCFLYGNIIRQNRIGVAAKNHAYILAMNNKFYDNTRAIALYRKESTFNGGNIYLLGNEFKANDLLYKIDKYSRVFNINKSLQYQHLFNNLINAKKYDDLFPIFDTLIHQQKSKEALLEAFYIGGKRAEVDEKNKVVFAALPQGADTLQKISYITLDPNTNVFIKPIFQGVRKTSQEQNREVELQNNGMYDFKRYIFYGKVVLKYKYLLTEYDIYVTTGTLPLIEIDTSGEHGIPRVIKNEPRIPCKVRIFSANFEALQNARSKYKEYTNTVIDAEIEGRGKKLPKWKYGIELQDAYPLEGMKNSKKWVLESSFVEKSLMRSKVAFQLMEQLREDKNRQRIAPEGRFVEVVLNGNYNGVYILSEHIDEKFLGLADYDKNKDNNALLYRARNINANFSPYNFKSFYKKDYKRFKGRRQPLAKADDPIWGWHSGYEQRHPHKKKYGQKWKPIEDFVRFTALASDEEFRAHIFELMDRESYIDLWIFTRLVDDSDGLFKNRYMARHQGEYSKWYIIPWDKDGVFGRLHNMKKRSYDKWLSTPLFKRCMAIPAFRSSLLEKWNRLRRIGIISDANINNMIDSNLSSLQDAQKRNFARWPVNYYMYPDTNDFNTEIEYMKDWIKKRIQWLDESTPAGKRIGIADGAEEE